MKGADEQAPQSNHQNVFFFSHSVHALPNVVPQLPLILATISLSSLSMYCFRSSRMVSEPEDESIKATDNMIRRSEEHTSELQSLMRISYAVFCLKEKTMSGTTL